MKFLKIKFTELFKRIINIINQQKSNQLEKALIKICKNYEFNKTSEHTIWDTFHLVKKVLLKNVKGDIVECGVETGHSLVLFQKIIELFNLENINIYGYDTFEGMPKPSDNDKNKYGELLINQYESRKINKNTSGWNNVSLETVQSNFYRNTKVNKNLKLVKGKVEKTLLIEDNLPKRISILKVDTCLYESTKIVLEILSSRVQKNGIIIIDNYFNYSGIKKATNEYCIKKGYSVKRSLIFGGADRVVIYL